MPKRDLSQGLSGAASQPMVRGKGYNLSITNSEAELEEPAASTNQVTEATKLQVAKEPTIKRENAKIEPSIIQEYKLLAVKQKRKLYEVMEEALLEYLKSHG